MTTMQSVVLAVHTLISVLIIALVLLQRGKGADAGAAFGAGASGTVFGARGSSSFFSRATAFLATAFFASSLTLAFMSSQRVEAPDSLIEGAPAVEFQDEDPQTGNEALPELPPADDAQRTTTGDEMPSLPDDAAAAEAAADDVSDEEQP